jgi:DNA-binding XRE family transcriptional regulator
MSKEMLVQEKGLAAIAKQLRKKAGKTRAQAARDMKVSRTSIFHAEESPKEGLVKLRSRMIEAYSTYKVNGPLFSLKKKMN